MDDPKNAKQARRQHSEQISLDEFSERHREYVDKGSAAKPAISDTPDQHDSAPLNLDAYLATALTGLYESERKHLFAASDVIESVCSSLHINLYQPRKKTDPVHNSEIVDESVFSMDREQVLKSDLLVHVANFPSTGSGQELDFALAGLIPIVLIAHVDKKVSRMVTGIPALKLTVRYNDLHDLETKLRACLTKMRPILEQRKIAFTDFDKNIVGHKTRIARHQARLTKEDVARQSHRLLTVERLRSIEENQDRIANPSLLELRTLATVLNTTVADLVEPDLAERLIAFLPESMLTGVAARAEMSDRDRHVVLRRILRRALESTENEADVL